MTMSKATSLTSISTETDASKWTEHLAYSLGLIEDRDDRSDGLLPMICTPHWSRDHFDFTAIDYSGNANVCFTAGFHVTGDPEMAWTPTAASRAVSIILAAKMFDSGVTEMCRTLAEIYSHYADVEAELEHEAAPPRLLPAFIADQKASRAFDLNE